MMNVGNETGTPTKPPRLTRGDDYEDWKCDFEDFVLQNDPDLLDAMLYGYVHPTVLSHDNKTQVKKSVVQMTEAEKKAYEKSKKAYETITSGLTFNILDSFRRKHKTAKALWDALELHYTGSVGVRKSKNDLIEMIKVEELGRQRRHSSKAAQVQDPTLSQEQPSASTDSSSSEEVQVNHQAFVAETSSESTSKVSPSPFPTCCHCLENLDKVNRLMTHNGNLVLDIHALEDNIKQYKEKDKILQERLILKQKDLEELARRLSISETLHDKLITHHNKTVTELDSASHKIAELNHKIFRFNNASNVLNFMANPQTRNGQSGVGFKSVPPPLNGNHNASTIVEEVTDFKSTTPHVVDPISAPVTVEPECGKSDSDSDSTEAVCMTESVGSNEIKSDECQSSEPEPVVSKCESGSESNNKKYIPPVGCSSSKSSKPNSHETKIFYKLVGSERVFCNDDRPIGVVDPKLISKVFTKSVPKYFKKTNTKSAFVKKINFVKGENSKVDQEKFLNESNDTFVQKKFKNEQIKGKSISSSPLATGKANQRHSPSQPERRETWRRVQSQQIPQNHAGGKMGQRNPTGSQYVERRTCFHCGRLGHVSTFCPHKLNQKRPVNNVHIVPPVKPQEPSGPNGKKRLGKKNRDRLKRKAEREQSASKSVQNTQKPPVQKVSNSQPFFSKPFVRNSNLNQRFPQQHPRFCDSENWFSKVKSTPVARPFTDQRNGSWVQFTVIDPQGRPKTMKAWVPDSN